MFPPTLLKERAVDAAKTWRLCAAFLSAAAALPSMKQDSSGSIF